MQKIPASRLSPTALQFLPHSVRAGLVCASTVAALLVSASAQTPVPPKVHVFKADATNTTANVLTMDEPDFNGQAGLKLIVTQYWTGTYNNHPIGVKYNYSTAKWQIVNEDGAAIPVGANFNVMKPAVSVRLFASPLNSYSDRTFFARQQKKPTALLFYTHLIDPIPRITGFSLTKNMGIFFIPIAATTPAPADSGKWSVYNEDLSTPGLHAYNISDATNDKVAGKPICFRFITTASNVTGIDANIDNLLTNANATAVLFVNHVYTTANPSVFNQRFGVSFFSAKWHIFTEDAQTPMPTGLEFNVEVFPKQSP